MRGTRPPRPLLPTLSNYILVSSSGIPKAHSSEILVSSASGTWDGIGAGRERETMNSSAGERGVRGEAGLSLGLHRDSDKRLRNKSRYGHE